MNCRRFMLLLLLLLVIFGGCSGKDTQSEKKPASITSAEQLNDPAYTIGFGTGTAASFIIPQFIPKAKFVELEDLSGYIAVKQGKLDAFAFDRKQMSLAINNGLTGVKLLPETIGEPVRIAIGISRKTKITGLKDKINAFIAELRDSGTLDDMYNRWAVKADYVMPDIAVPSSSSLKLTVGTTGVKFPYSYYEGNKLTGYDIEFARRFAAWLEAELEFKVYDYSGVVTAAATGEIDCIMANLNITPERAEKIDFSDVLYTEETALMVKDDSPAPAAKSYAYVSELDGKHIGVLTGTIHGQVVHEVLPSAKLSYFDAYANAVAALEAGKIDAVVDDEPIMLLVEHENPSLKRLDGYLKAFDNGFIFAKTPEGDRLRKEFNEFLRTVKSDGTLDRINAIWLGFDEEQQTLPDYENYPDTKGVLSIAVDPDAAPFNYVKDNKLVGYDVDIITRFCKARGYRPDINMMNFDGVLPAVKSGRCDVGIGAISITPERTESVNFSDVVYTGGAVALVRKTDSHPAQYTTPSQLRGKRIGVQTGIYEWVDIVNRLIPDAKIVYYNTVTDLVAALEANKIDAFTVDSPVLELIMTENDNIADLGEALDEGYDIAAAFGKSEKSRKLKAQFDEFVNRLKANGELDSIINIWTHSNSSQNAVLNYSSLPATNGVLHMATEGDDPPFSFYRDNKLVGLDVDLAMRFCEAYGYGLDVKALAYDAILPAISTGKYDLALASLSPSSEHAEVVLFSVPYYACYTKIAVLADKSVPKQTVREKVDAKTTPPRAKYATLDDLAGQKIGVKTGTTNPEILMKYIPTAKREYFDTTPDMLTALKLGKVEAICTGVPMARFMMVENDDVVMLNELLSDIDAAPIFPKTEKGRKLCDQFSKFTKSAKENGTLRELDSIWFGSDDSKRVVKDYADLPAVNGTLKMAVDLSIVPFSYVKDNKIVGYDVDFAVRFCEAEGYALEIVPMTFTAIIPALLSGKCDFAAGSIGITEERAENVLFSYPNAKTGNAIVVRKSNAEPQPRPAQTPPKGKYSSVAELAGKRLGVQTGMVTPQITAQAVPTAKLEYFDNIADTLIALKTGHIDAFCMSLLEVKYLMLKNDDITYIDEMLDESEGAPIFPKTEKGERLCAQFSEFIKTLWEDGTIDEMLDVWYGTDESKKVIKDYSQLPAPNGVLRVATDPSIPPDEYVKDNRIVGYDIECLVRFCEAYGYGLEIVSMNFPGIIPAVISGKCDLAVASFAITEERKENVLFSYPNFRTGHVFVVPKQKDNQFPELAGKKVGVLTGSNHPSIAAEVIPTAQLEYFESQADLFTALKVGKVDAISMNIPIAKFVMATDDSFSMIGEQVAKTECAPIFPKTEAGEKLCAQFSEFLKAAWDNGTIQEIDSIWFGQDDSRRVVKDYSKLPAPNGVLKMATDLSVVPFAYMKDNRIVGYDVDCAVRFCEAYGYGLEIVPMNFGAIIPAIKSGKCDFAACHVIWTPERAEQVLFAYPNIKSGIAYYVKKSPQGLVPTPPKSPLSMGDLLAHKKVAVQTGTNLPEIVAKFVPTAQVDYFDTQTDMFTALRMSKVDAVCTDITIARFVAAADDSFSMLGSPVTHEECSPIFPKTERGRRLRDQFDEFIKRAWEDGTMQDIDSIWFGHDESKRTVKDYSKLPAPNGVLRMATDLSVVPFAYMKDNRIVGYDVDCAVRFCEAYGYGLEVMPMNFGAIIPALQSGKCDFAASTITITKEREEQVLFAYPNVRSGVAFYVRKQDAQPQTQGTHSSFDELAHKKIAVQTGTNYPEIIAQFVPTAEVEYFDGMTDVFTALKAGKVDAVCSDIPIARFVMAADDSYTMLGNKVVEEDCAPIFPKTDAGRKLCDQFSEFLMRAWEDGTMQEIDSIWFGSDESRRVVKDYTKLPAPNGVLKMATDLSVVPFAYMKDNSIVGYDIDCAVRFCEAYGYGLEIVSMNFGAIIPSLVSGKFDFAINLVTITEERKEQVLFSYPNVRSGVAFYVRKQNTIDNANSGQYTSIKDLSGEKIGIILGANHDIFVAEKIPEAKIEYFNDLSAITLALQTGKIAAFTNTLPTAIYITHEHKDMSYIPEPVENTYTYSAFTNSEKGQKVCNEYAEFVKSLWDDGTIERLADKWIYSDNESLRTTEDYSKLPATNGVLKMAIYTGRMPFAYMKDNKITGYDIDIATRFCKAKGYGLEVYSMDFAGILGSIKTGKCDLTGSIMRTEERAETMLFSPVPNAETPIVLIVMKPAETTKPSAPSPAEDKPSFMDDVKSYLNAALEDMKATYEDLSASFNRTFIREERWRLFIEGIINTMIITVLSIMCGTMLGFMVYMFCRNGGVIANAISGFFVWLIKGMPMVVLLMILYYVIFGKVAIDGIWVAVIGFSLTFGSSVYAMILSGVKAIDRGQTEAAYALGFTDRRAFFSLILPQAALHFMPAYKGEVVALIKATAIVGYIAVQDLTKMGDIVRSRTYEAFFPLIAVAVIYFVLAGILNLVVNIIHNRIRPEKRTRDEILRGIDTRKQPRD